jgi:putative spermidine/putrescine transport system permease protein
VSLTWLGLAPFFLYAFGFLLLPAIVLCVGAFRTEDGAFTLDNVQNLFQAQFLDAYKTSIELSLLTALLGGLLGLLLAYAAIAQGFPGWIRTTLTTFSGVAANFGGVPLAFAFIATLGTLGLVTRFLDSIGIDIYANGFSLFTFTGLTITYLYFQIPLMVLVIAPAIDGLRREWREAASSLGASDRQYWRHIGLPILTPSLLGAMVLLFGSSFAAYATAYALTTGKINLVPLLIGQVVSGNVLSDPQMGKALSFGMIVVMAFSMVIYILLQRRAARWTR